MKDKPLSEKEVNLKTDDTCNSHVYNRTDVSEAVERLKEKRIEMLKVNTTRLYNFKYSKLTVGEKCKRWETLFTKYIQDLKELVKEIDKIFGEFR